MSLLLEILGSAGIAAGMLGVLGFLSRHWFLERLKGGIKSEYDKALATHKAEVEHAYAEKIEILRNEFRKQEGELAGQMRLRESEIAALRSGALSGSADRRAVLYRRRLQAVDIVWQEVTKLGPYRWVASVISITKIENAAKEASRNPKMRAIFETINQGLPEKPPAEANKERPYLSEPAWAYYSTLQAILFILTAVSQSIERGVEDVGKYLDIPMTLNLLKTALPEHSKLIDAKGLNATFNLIEELETKLLSELRKMLDGNDADEASVVQAAKILKAADDLAESQNLAKAQATAS
jgi:hypothetical protein